jgi:hypothetical protein
MITFGAAVAVATQPQAAKQAKHASSTEAKEPDDTIPHFKRIRASPKTWHDKNATDAVAAKYALNDLSGKRFRVGGVVWPRGRRSLLRRHGPHIIAPA